MAENVRWKHPDGEGGFTELNLPSSAEIVDYDGGTVKKALDDLSAVTSASTFMKSLLSASDAAAVRTLLRVSRDEFLNETGKQWHGLNAYPSTVQKKFGTRSCYFTGSNCYLRPLSTLKLGGSDFAIAVWAYIDDTVSSSMNLLAFYSGSSNASGIGFVLLNTGKIRLRSFR